VASAYCASGLPACEAARNSSAATGEILREQLALEIEQGEIVGGRRLSELGGGGEQLGALLAIDGADAPAKIEHGEGEYCLAIAAVGGEPVPLGRLLVVALDAQAVGIELGEQCHGLDVLVLVHPLGGDRKRRDVVAALERAVGQVAVASRAVVAGACACAVDSGRMVWVGTDLPGAGLAAGFGTGLVGAVAGGPSWIGACAAADVSSPAVRTAASRLAR